MSGTTQPVVAGLAVALSAERNLAAVVLPNGAGKQQGSLVAPWTDRFEQTRGSAGREVGRL